jgi:serine/threonine-protein kinase HipA
MAVGDRRHYVIDSIAQRHFLQTAENAAVSPTVTQGILDEIQRDADRAIEEALTGLPAGFPDAISKPIIEGVRRRLRLLEHAAA